MAHEPLTKPKKEKTEAQVECIHYWVLEPPFGPISKGVCKICGTEREFKNFERYSIWESDSSRREGDIPSLSDLGVHLHTDSDVEDEQN